MKRRDFIGTLVAGVVVAALPATSFASKDSIIWNAETLTAKLEAMFSCRMGPAASLCYINGKNGDVINPGVVVDLHPISKLPLTHIKSYAPAPEGYSGYYYETYALVVEGGTAEEAEAKLAKHFYDEFSKVPAGQLVWRVKPHFESAEMVEYGETFLTHAQLEDRAKFTIANGQITAVDYTNDGKPIVPDDVELEFESNSYKHVKRKYTLHKMRMRLVLPDKYDEDELAVASLHFIEGGKPQRI